MATTERLGAKTFIIVCLVLFFCLANAELENENGQHCDKGIEGDKVSGRRLLGKDEKEKGDKPEKPEKGDKPEKPEKGDKGDKDPAPGGPEGAAPGGAVAAGPDGLFDILKAGAVADGKTDSSAIFMKTWQAACQAPKATILVPKGAFMTKPLVFQGPCKAKPLIFQLDGTLVAPTDLSVYPEDTWILFQSVDGVSITGTGVLDGTGASAWKFNDCKKNKDCAKLPSNMKFQRVTNGAITGITSLNSKYFHFHVTDCTGITVTNIKITAPGDSPNTDGIHFSDSTKIKLTTATIATGDDCISVGPGVEDASFTGIACGPGHGLSVGSIGKRSGEKPVKGVSFTDCTITGTTNGARIKSFGDSPPGSATGITYKGITMKDVENPIIIDQNYGNKGASKTIFSDIHFIDIKGTSKTPVSVLLDCSPSNPCEAELSNINLPGTATCTNAKTTSTGPVVPACKGGAPK
ncbi:Pectin lyase-like superfamily protein [Euphorbia peplus]|nr:Pectin lyase-like superfamily protein [Euphorbia peplus]